MIRRLRKLVLITGTLLCVVMAVLFVVSGWWMLPLCALFVAALLATRAIWWFAPKFPPGHCPCGYDLTGNVSGTFPECGIEDRIE